MGAFFWAALGFLVVAALAGGAFVGLRAWRTWQAFTSLAAGAAAGVEGFLMRAERLASHAGRTAERAEGLLNAVGRLERSVARARILLGAVGEVRDLVRAVRAFVPQK